MNDEKKTIKENFEKTSNIIKTIIFIPTIQYH